VRNYEFGEFVFQVIGEEHVTNGLKNVPMLVPFFNKPEYSKKSVRRMPDIY
jgi:hypothetical protein